MKDANLDPKEDSPYECFDCGNVVIAGDNPVACPECSGALRNRRTPLE